MLKILTNIRNAGWPLQTCHFVVGWFILRSVNLLTFLGFNPRQRIFSWKPVVPIQSRFDSSLFDTNSRGEILIALSIVCVNKLQSKRLCIQMAVNHFSLSWLQPRANRLIIGGQQLPSLLDVTRCIRLLYLLHVVACCWELLRKVSNWSNF